ncbi:GH15040 [Drosophila grimshawi]|uniref:GH15040 n=1 Tax=Drosophila grimshawi TaxID=7222 RepID=B4IZX7_DROGR|nr:GH15040 [Drosophila grimshawi]
MPAQLVFNELLETGPVNEDKTYYNEPQLKYPQEQQQLLAPNYFVNKWPSLRDLLLTADYDDSSSVESAERERYPLGSRLLERLHQLGDNGEGFVNTLDDLTAVKSKKHNKVQSNSKQHNIKKNVQYMSPCHFKICNMGRKRNSGSYVPY